MAHEKVAVGTTVTRAFLPFRATLIAVADVIREQDVFAMSEAQFVSAVMTEAKGAADPMIAKMLLADLRAEAF